MARPIWVKYTVLKNLDDRVILFKDMYVFKTRESNNKEKDWYIQLC